MTKESASTRYELLPYEYSNELQHLRQEDNASSYYAGYNPALLPGFCFFVTLLFLAFILVMCERSPDPVGLINYGWLGNIMAAEQILYVTLAVAAIMLILFLLYEIYRVWGKSEFFNTSFGLVQRSGSRVEISDYEQMVSARLSSETASDPDRRHKRVDAGSVLTVKMASGRSFSLKFGSNSRPGDFLAGVKERFGKKCADLSIIKAVTVMPSYVMLPVYTAVSVAVGMIVVNAVLVPMHNHYVRESAANGIFEIKDGQTVLTADKNALKAYLDIFPAGSEKERVQQKYREVIHRLLREHAYDLVRFRDSEYLRNSKMYEYRSDIESYNSYFREAILQDELELMFFHTYDQWLALVRAKNFADKAAERLALMELRDHVADSKAHWLALYNKMAFYRIYFEDNEFKAEEEMLGSSNSHEQWKNAFMSGNMPAEVKE